ncbi:MAG: Mth938-like domain-containing protein [Pseudomonadota bacterium]
MRLNEIDFEGQQPPIDGYGPGGFRVAEVWHEGDLLMLPSGASRFSGLSAEGLAPVLAAHGDLDVLLIGMGAEIAPLAPDLRAPLEAVGIGVEIMSTPSACRTYNVLLAEDRRVAVVALAV